MCFAAIGLACFSRIKIRENKTSLIIKESIMIKEIGSVKNVQACTQKNSKMLTFFCGLALLTTAFMAGCQKDNSTATTPVPAAAVQTDLATAMAQDIDGAPLNLRSAAGFTILSETGISTTGTTSVNGNMGVSPIAAIGITGFGLIMDASHQFSRSSLVYGDIFAANYSSPTPSKMTTAISDMKTAYTVANGRTYPAPIVEKYAGNLSGRTLPPGLYKWSTGVLVTNAGVTLNGLADDIWVFQVAKNFTVDNSAIITLEGGAQTKNIFWVVAGKVVIGTGVHFSGNVLCKTLISVNAGSKIHGRLLSQTAVTLIASAVTAN